MDDASHLDDVVLEQPQRVGVGDHDAGRLRAHRRLQRRQVDASVGPRGDLPRCHAHDGHAGRVGAVRRVRDQDLGSPGIAARLVPGADDEHAQVLAVGAGRRHQAAGGEAGDLAERLLQVQQRAEQALDVGHVLLRVQVGQPRHRRDLFVEARVVLHRAAAQGVHAALDVVVEVRQRREVAHHLRLAEGREIGGLRAPHGGRQLGRRLAIPAREGQSATAGAALVEQRSGQRAQPAPGKLQFVAHQAPFPPPAANSASRAA